jgi:hypothetical protein
MISKLYQIKSNHSTWLKNEKKKNHLKLYQIKNKLGISLLLQILENNMPKEV